MKPRSSSCDVSRFSCRGSVLLLALFLVVLFGLFVGIQAVAVTGVLKSGVALRVAAGRESIVRTLGHVAEESILSGVEGYPDVAVSREQRMKALLEKLCPRGWKLSVESAGRVGADAVPGFPWQCLPAKEGGVNHHALVWARAGQARWIGASYHAGAEDTVQFIAHPTIPDSGPSVRVRYDVCSVSVPLLRPGFHRYQLPEDFGDTMGGDLGLDWHFRPRASEAAAYAKLFSKTWLREATLWTGPWSVQTVHEEKTTSFILDGFAMHGSEASMDLSKAGTGEFAGERRASALICLLLDRPGTVLRLFESDPDPLAAPLMVFVVGGVDAGIRLSLESVSRPIVLVGCNAIFSCVGPVHWAGALIVGPGSRFDALPEVLHAAHISLPYLQPDVPGLFGDYPWNLRLHEVSPHVVQALVSPPKVENIL